MLESLISGLVIILVDPCPFLSQGCRGEEYIQLLSRRDFYYFFFIFLYRAGPQPHIPFPPDLILYVNLVAKGAPKFFKTLAPRLIVLDIPYFADAFSRTLRPIDLHNF